METGKKDRISKYLIKFNKDMLFGELSEDFLHAMGAQGLLSGIPVPISEGENGQIRVLSIVLDMAKVIGADPDFVYADKYLAYGVLEGCCKIVLVYLHSLLFGIVS